MLLRPITKYLAPILNLRCSLILPQRCLSSFSIQNVIIEKEKDRPEFTIQRVSELQHGLALDMVKQHYLADHVLVRARNMVLNNDRAIDEYLIGLFKQGNSLLAKTEDGALAAICVSFASSPVDAKNLRNYAFYRQDPDAKDFLYFTAKLQETPNLWMTFRQQKIFEIKMLAVAPEYRRLGLAVSLVEKSMHLAGDQGYNVVRMDCINRYDYKIAERCMLQCIVKFPLHKLRSAHAPFIKRMSTHDQYVRVYISAREVPDVPDLKSLKGRAPDSLILE